MYRFHEKDPIHFQRGLKVAIQQIGWNRGLFERSDDWCGVAYWYQAWPTTYRAPLPNWSARTADILEAAAESK